MPTIENLDTLPVGISSFTGIRKDGFTYIDKTALIYQIASKYRAKIFLVRPRRFGKSLLVSTLESLFRDGLKWFQNLAIAKLWNDKQYKVLTLDFSDAKDFCTFEEFLNKLRDMLNDSFWDGGFNFSITEEKDPMTGFGEFLRQNEELVLLIDEYDAPFNTHLDNPALFESVRVYLSGFYSKIKKREHSFRFIFITGIIKFNHTKIFSAFNNLIDISLDQQYGTLLGYTKEEIEFYLSPYIDRAATKSKGGEKTREEIIQDMWKKYDGFCFDEEGSTHVYCPWSVLNFLDRPERGLKNYWYLSGGKPIIIMNTLEKIQVFIKIYNNEEISIPITMLEISNSPDILENEVILFYAGYFTIKGSYTLKGIHYVILNYPNKEVEESFPSLLFETVTENNNIPFIYKAMRKAFIEDNIQEIFEKLNSIFIGIHYTSYPIRDESTCRAMLQIFMKGLGFTLTVENGNAYGRSDIEVLCDNSVWVFEIKYLKGKFTALKAKKLLKKAVEQMQSHCYGKGIGVVKKIRRLALVFSEEQRALVACKLDHSTLPQG